MQFLYFDYIRVIAIFLVVLVHVTAPSLLTEDYFVEGWEICLSMNVMARLGVPLFFMISGALFLNPEKRIDCSYLRKKIIRLVVAFFVFSTLYSVFWFLCKQHFCFSFDDIIHLCLPRFINGWFHLWFLQALVVLYILTPVLRVIIIDKMICSYFTILLFCVCSLFPFIGNFINFEPYIGELLTNMSFQLPQYTLFFILGYICSQFQYEIKPWILLVGVCAILLITIFFDISQSVAMGHPAILWSGYLSPFIIVCSCLVFLFLKKIVPNYSSKMIQMLSANSFGIYLTHVFLIEGFLRIHYFPLSRCSGIAYPLLSVTDCHNVFHFNSAIKKNPIV